MASFGVWDLCIAVLIPHRRLRNYALVLGWRRGLLLVGSRRILALRFSLGVSRVARRLIRGL
jgi:hypothetical protein